MNAPFVTPYDVETIRAEFPILSQQVYGKPLVYLDNAASAQKPRAVIDAMVRTMETGYSNVHRGLHYMANAATEGFEGAREDVRRFLNARSTDEIVFTKSATEGYNLVANSFGTMGLGEGDEIILSIMEHHSNIVPWHFLRERKGAVIRWVPVDDDGNFLLDEYEKLFSPKTRMVAITHMSNVLGTVTPASEIVRIAHEHGVPVLLDGAQGAVHLSVDVQELDCDFYVMTGHKLYGPTGVGVLYGKREWLEKMPPYQGGGEMINEVRCEGITYNEPPHRFEAGTPPIVEAIGLGAAVRFMMELGRERIQAHEAARQLLCARAPARHERAPDHRPGPGQGRDHRLRDERRARARRRDRDRPPGRRGPGRHPLRHAAAYALRRHLDLPCVLRPLQHHGGSG